MASDVIDGYLARRFNAETYFGKVVDLISDKSLTMVSLLYAAARGIDIVPLALIATREIITLGARRIIVEGTELLPTNKILGGIMWFLVWGNTLFLIFAGKDRALIRIATVIYWGCAIALALNLIARIYISARRIRISLAENQ